jgi:hypothetical protein
MDDETGGTVHPGTVHPPVGATAGEATGGFYADRDRPAPVPHPETGEPRVDAALSRLDDLTELPVTEHPAVFERVHAQLSEVLGELSSGAMTGLPGRDGN